MEKHIGYYLRLLHWCADQAMTNALASMDLTAAQGSIMVYLNHRKEPPCCRDIEEEFHLSHPTVSGLLARLEKKQFIEFRPDPQDRRCKRICVLPKGEACQALMHRTVLDNEERMMQGFSPEERAQFLRLLQRSIENMGVSPCKRGPNKEEDPT